MTTIESITTTIERPDIRFKLDEAELAASFLGRYSGRTHEAYRHDLRGYFQWAADNAVEVLKATRGHQCIPPTRGLDRSELGVFPFTAERYDHAHAALALLLGLNGLRVSEACATNVEDLAVERGHRMLRIVRKGNKPTTIPLVSRTARIVDLAVGERHEGPILRRRDGQRLDRRTAHRWVRSIGKRAGLGSVHPHMLRAAFIWPPSTPESRSETYRSLPATPTFGRPRPTDRRRQNFDRHAAYVVVAIVASG
jgi:integrase/recombinase XerD